MMNTKKLILSILAPITTVTSLVMVVSNSVTRGVTRTDETILSLLAVVICLGTHLLPALSKHREGWLRLVALVIWSFCLVATMFNLLSFFTNVSTVAGEIRAKSSVQVVNSTQQIESVKQALSRISARPVAVVTRELSRSTNVKRRAALTAESDEAKRAEKLQDKLFTLQSSAVTIQSAASKDPLLSLLESVTGINAAVISIFIGTTFALVLEFMAVFLWYELLSESQMEVKTEISVSSVSPELKDLPSPDVVDSLEDKQLASVKHAIATGQIRKNIKAIRKYLKCGQDTASSVRKALDLPQVFPCVR